MAQRATDHEGAGGEHVARAADTVVLWAESVVYGGVAVVLIAGAAILLGHSVVSLVEDVDRGVVPAMTALLSELLLVFVFVELLGAVRVTIRERELLAEPFLLVGIIASIKEIVVIAGTERKTGAPFEEFRNAMVEIGLLAGIILALSIAALLLRRRQREPAEADG